MGLKLNNLFDRGMGTHGEDGGKSLKNDNVPVIAGHYLVAEIGIFFGGSVLRYVVFIPCSRL